MQLRIDKATEQLKKIDKHISVGRLYDVGAAGGFVMKAAIDRGWEVYGNELSKKAVHFAKRTYQIDIFHGYVEDDLSATDDTFDLIIFWNTLEHMRDPIQTMCFAANMLRKNGCIHFRVPIKDSENMLKFHEGAHMVEFQYKSLELLLEKSGLEEISNEPFAHRIPCADLLWRKP